MATTRTGSEVAQPPKGHHGICSAIKSLPAGGQREYRYLYILYALMNNPIKSFIRG